MRNRVLSDQGPMISNSGNQLNYALCLCVWSPVRDCFSCACLLFMSWKGIMKPQTRSHNTINFIKEKILCFKIFATCYYFCHCKA